MKVDYFENAPSAARTYLLLPTAWAQLYFDFSYRFIVFIKHFGLFARSRN